MDNTMIRLWIHIFFSTKDCMPLIKESIEKQLYFKIKIKITEEYQSHVKNINGTENHVHILFSLNPSFRLTDIMKNIKGETSHWINQNKFLDAKFSWQKSYNAYSVSESKLEEVNRYISNQKKIHEKISFYDERELFLKKIEHYNNSDKTV
ncbi:MAG TPA: IS200/IS605 family transposase [Ignavibacteria bacterium]|nr:IS200/IS605 family transposase [Ignavibacteria bacterium]